MVGGWTNACFFIIRGWTDGFAEIIEKLGHQFPAAAFVVVAREVSFSLFIYLFSSSSLLF